MNNNIKSINAVARLGIVLVAISVLVAAGCGQAVSSLQPNPASALGDTKAAAGSATLGRVTMATSVRKLSTGWYAKFTARNTTLVQGTLFFTNGTSVSKTLSGTSGYIQTSNNAPLWYIRLKAGNGDYWYFDKNGDYWYFDRTGTWKPGASKTSSSTGSDYGDDTWLLSAVTSDGTEYVALTCNSGGVRVQSTVALDYATLNSGATVVAEQDLTGNAARLDLSGLTDYVSSVTVLTADGCYWHFDASLWGWDADGNDDERGSKQNNRGGKKGHKD